jgi:YVTN family beta-propeller protein
MFIKSKSFVALSFAAIAMIGACSKSSTTTIMPNLNINYAAAFVVNGGDNNVQVVNLTTNKVAETIGLNGASFPHHVYFNNDKSLMAVAIISQDVSAGHAGHGSSGATGYKIIVLETKTGNEHHILTTTALPHNGIFSPDGKELWVSQGADAGEVLVFNTTGFTQLKSIKVGKTPSEVTFSADGSLVFVANTGDATVTTIDPSTKTVKGTISVGTAPVGAWAAANGKMYCDNETSQTVSEIDVATQKVTETIALGFKPGYVAYNAMTKEVWVSDATNGKVVYYQILSGKWTKKGEIVTGADAHAITFTDDLKTAYVTNQGAATVSVIMTTDHKVTSTIAVGSKPNGIVLKQ